MSIARSRSSSRISNISEQTGTQGKNSSTLPSKQRFASNSRSDSPSAESDDYLDTQAAPYLGEYSYPTTTRTTTTTSSRRPRAQTDQTQLQASLSRQESPYQPTSKMVSNSQIMDGQRQQYIPGPPPLPNQTHLMHLPPPPPPRAHPPAPQQGLPPPPPGPHPSTLPQGTVLALPGGWQQSWARHQGMSQGLPPPPPMMNSNQQQNQHLAYSASHLSHGRQPTPLSIPPPPQYDKPLVSATFIPGGDSFGPGVGIPPLEDNQSTTYPRYEIYPPMEGSRSVSAQQYHDGFGDNPYLYPMSQPYSDGMMRDPSILPSHMNRAQHPQLPKRDISEPISPGPPTATLQNPQPTSGPDPAKPASALHRQSTSSISMGGPSPRGASSKWPLENVLIWLAANGFSDVWQETFRTLGLQGSDFLELGRGKNGRGNLGMMHQVVYPQLAKVCSSSKNGWDQGREREEGQRLRRLIRRIADNDDVNAIYARRRESSQQSIPSASTEGNVENSPNLTRQDFPFTPPTTGIDGSPGKQPPAQISSGFGPRTSGRSSTLPVFSKSGSQGSTPSDPSNSESLQHCRADFSRNILNTLGNRGRHSSSASGEISKYSVGLAPRYEGSPQNGSPALVHALPAPAAGPGSTSQGRHEHAKSNSTDSTMKTLGQTRPSHSYTVNGAMGLEGPMTGRFYESRSNGQDSNRPSPLEAGKNWSAETVPMTKEHSKGFLSKFMNRRKHDPAQPSPEEASLDSPTSPGGFRPFNKLATNGSDTSLVPRSASTSLYSEDERPGTRGRAATKTSSTKKFIFVTPDHWNYRLIEITEVDSADDLRKVICAELNIPDPESASIYVTEPGQSEHAEPLTDNMLILNRRTRSDHLGSLKFYVRSPVSSAALLPMPPSAGLGLSFAQRAQASPSFTSHFGRKPPDEETYARLTAIAQTEGKAVYLGSREPTLKGTSRDSATSLSDLESQRTAGGREALIQKAAEEFQREAERKQKAYQESRQQKRESSNVVPGSGIRANNVVDFDSPRHSPFEEKQFEVHKPEMLVPVRRPPTAPSESTTLAKVNSLTRKSGDHRSRSSAQLDALKRISDPIAEETADLGRRKAIGPTSSVSQGIGAALVSVGKMAGAPASLGSQGNSSQGQLARAMGSVDFGVGETRGNSPGGSPRSPRFTWGKGNMLFKVPNYEEDHDPQISVVDLPQNPIVQRLRRPDPSPVVSPASDAPIPGLSTRKSYGPDFDFKETRVDFAASPRPQEDSDSEDDSDDGLFAVPLANQSSSKNSSGDNIDKTSKPALTVDTDHRAKKVRSVTFKSPSTSGPSAGPSTRTSGSGSDLTSARSSYDRSLPDTATTYSGLAESPEDKSGRRASFASEIWASRPPVENVVNHLDDFFPGVDLDEPYLEEGGESASSPMSSTDKNPVDAVSSLLRRRIISGTEDIPLKLSKMESDTLGSDESTLKAKDRDTIVSVNSMAQHQMRKSGGLGRMKSIREVAKGRNDVSRSTSRALAPQASTANASGILRRKSTKMFGANIVQIRPKPGNRLSTLDPIPQEEVPREDTPKRQATFKIIRGQLIGKGTYGRVYLGMNATTGEFLAVKQVEVNQKAAHHDKNNVKEMVAALDQEIDTMQHLEHPNIVQYLGCERKEFSISIYLEYISGGSVGSCLRKHGKFEESVVKSLTRQTLEGLAYLHGEGILHRDLKADNILLDLDGTCKISDFGISKKSDNIYGNDITNSMQGSVFWMAPEVVRSQGRGYSAKVDVWSLGCVVLEMFAGRRPWSREEAIGAIFKLGSLNQAPPIPDDVSSTASPDGLNFMYNCFEVVPSDRPTADTLLRHSTFCIPDPYYNFYDTELAAKLRSLDSTASND